MSKKSLSVIIPAYKVEDHIEACLESMLVQYVEDLEVIIIDDGSPDNTGVIARKYADLYPHIFQYHHKENGGLAGETRNYGLQFVTKEYLTFLDSDDYITEGGYGRVLDQVYSNDLDMATIGFKYLYGDGSTEVKKLQILSDESNNDLNYVLADPMPWSKVIRTSIFMGNNLKFPEGIFYEDLALMPTLIKYCEKIAFLEEPIYYYRQSVNSIMRPKGYSARLLDIIEACRILYEELKDTRYEELAEFLITYQLCYFHTMKFLSYGRTEDIKACMNYLNNAAPRWHTNQYYRRKGKLFRLYCYLIRKEAYGSVKLLIKARSIARR